MPWASPVWFAVGDDRALYFSRQTSVHSQNIAARTDVSVVVFDTNARVGEAQADYARARATQVPDGDGIDNLRRGVGPGAHHGDTREPEQILVAIVPWLVRRPYTRHR